MGFIDILVTVTPLHHFLSNNKALPIEPRVLAHEAPCLVTMLRILGREDKHLNNMQPKSKRKTIR